MQVTKFLRRQYSIFGQLKTEKQGRVVLQGFSSHAVCTPRENVYLFFLDLPLFQSLLQTNLHFASKNLLQSNSAIQQEVMRLMYTKEVQPLSKREEFCFVFILVWITTGGPRWTSNASPPISIFLENCPFDGLQFILSVGSVGCFIRFINKSPNRILRSKSRLKKKRFNGRQLENKKSRLKVRLAIRRVKNMV